MLTCTGGMIRSWVGSRVEIFRFIFIEIFKHYGRNWMKLYSNQYDAVNAMGGNSAVARL